MAESAEMSFEQALARLEEIVARLDGGDLPLDESMRLFQEGMALKDLCVRLLTEAEAVVEQYCAEMEPQIDLQADEDDPFQ
ncbi:MAG: exodeoxyribonuclease VII small subunit [Armatimonadetes bacterium]|nr:exodeoxyribonuclease VII small subunit [Armatimonadota bacterium]